MIYIEQIKNSYVSKIPPGVILVQEVLIKFQCFNNIIAIGASIQWYYYPGVFTKLDIML